MRIGITGHQERVGIDWAWVRSHLDLLLSDGIMLTGYSSLAAGTDQIFANVVIEKGGQLIAVIPMDHYESYFEPAALEEYMQLLKLAQVIELKSMKQDQRAFLDAGEWIVRETDRIIAVWDGEQAEGTGGTGDIVAYARSLKKPVVHLNPISRKITNI